jgi:hypothetical protein
VLDPVIVAFGLGVGALIGLTGIGGGSLMTPLLILVLGTKPVVAIGTDLAYGAITKTLGGWKHIRMGTVDGGVALWLAVGSLPGAIVGVILIDQLHDASGGDFDGALLVAVAVALLVVALTLLVRVVAVPPDAVNETHSYHFTTSRKIATAATGFVLGVTLGVTSIGSGALVGAVLIFVFRLTPRRVVGTDVAHAALLLWAAGIAHWIGGNVNLELMANILVGSLPGVWIGTSLVARVDAQLLRPILGCVLLGSSLGILSKAGAAIPVWCIVAVPIGVGLSTVALMKKRGCVMANRLAST